MTGTSSSKKSANMVSSDTTLSDSEKPSANSQNDRTMSSTKSAITRVGEESIVDGDSKNPNSFFFSFLKIKPVQVLLRVKELGIAYGDPTPYPITPFILVDHLGNNKKKAEYAHPS
ncbi:hypothetical protein F5146DRAFT_1004428 [Armillaria mellea]|nr:hypothetical protein F5146DRAFT_1004428 [Armillaria mellea]